jgi:hypothetical protein
LRLQRDTTARAEFMGGVEQVEADERMRVGIGPCLAVLGNEAVLARDPIRLGVDECAVHVPQHRRQLRHPDSVPAAA